MSSESPAPGGWRAFLAAPDPKNVRPLLVLFAAILVAGAVFAGGRSTASSPRGVVLDFFHFLWANLPLTLPVLSACLSLMLNYRDILKPNGWLKLPLPFALGLVSFSIWYVVAAQTAQDDYIRIGPSKVLFKQYSLILVITAFIWAGFCAMARVNAEDVQEADRGWAWHLQQMALLAISAFALAVPFLLFEDKAVVEERTRQSLDERLFTVSLAWKDPSLYPILGKRSDEMVFCQVLRQVPAKTPSEAVDKGKDAFLRSPESRQRFGTTPPDAQVKVQDQMLVAEVDTGIRR